MIKDKLLTLPVQPGCYLMKDINGEVIYVGKAKNLKNRVNSYFRGSSHDNKTTRLVNNIVDFDYIVTNSEKEALILEYNLIKHHKPRFNIIFMDDSSYPYLRLTVEKYPTLRLVRDARRMKNAKYFGPYPNVGYARELLSLIEKIYPLRKCKNMGSKVCLYYHIGLCLGPCEFEISPKVYEDMTEEIISFLNGNTGKVIDELMKKRDEFAENLLFEKAGEMQTLIESVEHVTAENYMQINLSESTDVFACYVDKGYISIVGLLYYQGKLLHQHLNLKPLYDDVDETFISYIVQYYQSNPLPKELIMPYGLDLNALGEALEIKIFQPQRGEKKKLIELAIDNAKIHLEQNFEIYNKQMLSNDIALEQLRLLIQCNTTRIELFDISHISGKAAVGAQVVYVDGTASKKDYRLYKVSNKNNDYANMQEVIYRRLFRAVKRKTILPDVIIVDGGKSQINAVKEILDSLEITSICLLALIKNEKHQTSSLMNDSYEIYDIDKESDLFYLLANMQDEVHRFAISYHKRLREKKFKESVLDEIDGIGFKRKQKLLHHFKTINKVKEATVDQLADVIGKKSGQAVYDFFRKEEENV
ncbi:MAG: excinuclease ABC subunit UvrC [Bacillota bacterium]|jgi:excinuclease ABC subunit C|nr:excinuclease ABC subunit UvrC [Bacillota bacterium]NLL26697.1 excinuclease ABC subunit UvrC [Erysipelotrichia bacterium]